MPYRGIGQNTDIRVWVFFYNAQYYFKRQNLIYDSELERDMIGVLLVLNPKPQFMRQPNAKADYPCQKVHMGDNRSDKGKGSKFQMRGVKLKLEWGKDNDIL